MLTIGLLCPIKAKSTLNFPHPWMRPLKSGCDSLNVSWQIYTDAHSGFVSRSLRKHYQPNYHLTGQEDIIVFLCFGVFLMWLQPRLHFAAPVLKALTCDCCLLAADVIVCDRYSVFVGTLYLSVWRRLDLATSVRCPEEKNLCTCLCLCKLSRGKSHQEPNVESFAKMRSSCQGVLKPSYLWRQITLLLLDIRDQWVTEVRPAN